jgi:hypothetical protein
MNSGSHGSNCSREKACGMVSLSTPEGSSRLLTGEGLPFVNRGKAARSRLVDRVPRLGHVDTAGGAAQELAAEPGLEFLDLAADGRRRQAELARCANE